MTKDDYLNRMISMPRNMNLAIVFNRLGLIEKFGTGIVRIWQAYQNSLNQPEFDITDRHITVTLPVAQKMNSLTPEVSQILNLIKKGTEKRTDLRIQSGLSNYQVGKALKFLQEKGLIQKIGSTRSARFIALQQ